MIYKITVLCLMALSSTFCTQSSARVELGRVGSHQVRIADPSTRSQLVSVPFLKSAISRGRLDGVSTANFQDAQGAFAAIDAQDTYILRIAEGSAAGAWFFLGAASANGTSVEVLNDGFAGMLSDLQGNESFSVHALYTLNELFPEDGIFLPAGDIDLKAMQVHFYDGREFKKFWLSNATITEHVGRTTAEGGELVYAGETVILPGTSFLVLDPRAGATVNIRIQGNILDAPLHVPIYPGYNFVSSNYNKRFDGNDVLMLGHIGLKESGFKPSDTQSAGDRVFAYDAATSRFGQSFYLDATTGEFNAPSDFQPSAGFIVFNSGEAYLWGSLR